MGRHSQHSQCNIFSDPAQHDHLGTRVWKTNEASANIPISNTRISIACPASRRTGSRQVAGGKVRSPACAAGKHARAIPFTSLSLMYIISRFRLLRLSKYPPPHHPHHPVTNGYCNPSSRIPLPSTLALLCSRSPSLSASHSILHRCSTANANTREEGQRGCENLHSERTRSSSLTLSDSKTTRDSPP